MSEAEPTTAASSEGCVQSNQEQEGPVNGEEVTKSEEQQVQETAETKPDASRPAGAQSTEVAAAAPKIRHDWYQTQADVYVNVMIKRLKKEDVSVEFGERTLNVFITVGEGREHSLDFHLAHSIVPQKSSFKVLTTKVEVKMRKCEGLQWAALEGLHEGNHPKPPQMAEVKENVAHKYPSSSHYTRDWDKLVVEIKNEEKDEKLEGDAALNQLFQKIYKDGNEEVRKAMNKSFVESGGTVLSTNWSEVGSKEVERKPPDGMEWKKYEV